MRHFLDDFWESVKARYPGLRLWDAVYDQSHMHHTLVTILGFGALGVLFAVAFHGLSAIVQGFAVGMLGGCAGYMNREFWSLRRWRLGYHGSFVKAAWDGTLDVLVPVVVTVPWSVAALVAHVPWWTGALLYAGAALMAWLYTFGRPNGFLYYH